MSLVLYYAPGSSSFAPHIALNEIGCAFELRRISLSKTAPRDPAYLALNPEGKVPTLVIDGEPLTEPPRDLYIPPDALEVFFDTFEGPLDLLLYLIRRQNLDILDIPIAEISRQYVEYIELMKEMQFELAGEYLVMAATLAVAPRASDESGCGWLSGMARAKAEVTER